MDIIAALAAKVVLFFQTQAFWMIGFGIVCAAPIVFPSHACNPGQPWWRSQTLASDIGFGLLNNIVQPYVRVAFAIGIVFVMTHDVSPESMKAFLEQGAGPLASAPIAVQIAFYLLGSDFLLYWAHRLFHGRRLWPFHAVHHAPELLDWTVMYRNHPVNAMMSTSLVMVVMVALGVPPWLMAALVPFDAIASAWVHSNLNWDGGPLKRVIATPVFHRWHHTGPDEGGSSNFASTFAFIDVLFGTYYMPEGKLPKVYGVDDPTYPKDFVGQLLQPFARVARGLRGERAPPPSPLPTQQ